MLTAKSFGAAGDGRSLDTKALQLGIDECAKAGGGVLLLEPGVYLSGSLRLRSGVELRLQAGAKLLGSTDLKDYEDFKAPGFRHELAPEGSSKTLLWAYGERNVAITGQGEINGSGPAFYDKSKLNWGFYAKPASPRPRMLMLFDCENVKIEDASFVDSPCWTFWLIKCRHVNVARIKLLGNQMMINNDGIDIDSCQDVVVSDSFFKTGDDCLILRSVKDLLDEPAPCENVVVTNCLLDSRCQGIRVGCPSDGEIRRCAFSNIVFSGEGAGINVDNPKRYLHPGDGGSMDLHDIAFSNFVIESGRQPIRIWVEDGVALKRIEGLSFSNVLAKGGLPSLISGNPQSIVRGVRFDNVSLDKPLELLHCQDVVFNGKPLAAKR